MTAPQTRKRGAADADNPHGLLLYDADGSPCARRVRITLLEKGLAWEQELLDLSRLEQRSPAYLAINANGTVPALAHGTRVIHESNVITAYLDDAFPDRPLYPDDPWELAQVRMWQASELAMARDYQPLFHQRLMGPLVHLTRTLDETLAIARRSTRDPADLAWAERVWTLAVLTPEEEADAEARLIAWLDRLEKHLATRAYLVGERLTPADIAVYPRIAMYPYVGMPIAADRHPHVSRWMERLGGHASFAQTLSPGDRTLEGLARTDVLPALARLRAGGERQTLSDRLRLVFLRRAARRALPAAPRSTANDRPAIRPPAPGRIAPADTPRRPLRAATAEERAQPLTLYDYAASPHARRIRWLLSDKGLRWTTVDVDLARLAHRAPEFLAINPDGAIPALRHGERVLGDSQVIAEYLDAIYPGVPFFPTDAYQLAQVRMWLALEAGTDQELRPLFWLSIVRPALHAQGITEADVERSVADGVSPSDRRWLREVLAGRPRADSSEELARGSVAKKLDVLERRLVGSREFLVGDGFTMADAAWCTRLELLPALGMPLPTQRYPNLVRWLARIGELPSAAASRR